MRIIDIKQHQKATRAGIKAIQSIIDYYTDKSSENIVEVNPHIDDGTASYDINSNTACFRIFTTIKGEREPNDSYQIATNYNGPEDVNYFIWNLKRLDDWLFRYYNWYYRHSFDNPIKESFYSANNAEEGLEELGSQFANELGISREE